LVTENKVYAFFGKHSGKESKSGKTQFSYGTEVEIWEKEKEDFECFNIQWNEKIDKVLSPFVVESPNRDGFYVFGGFKGNSAKSDQVFGLKQDEDLSFHLSQLNEEKELQEIKPKSRAQQGGEQRAP